LEVAAETAAGTAKGTANKNIELSDKISIFSFCIISLDFLLISYLKVYRQLQHSQYAYGK
jgi:hypothetical protein